MGGSKTARPRDRRCRMSAPRQPVETLKLTNLVLEASYTQLRFETSHDSIASIAFGHPLHPYQVTLWFIKSVGSLVLFLFRPDPNVLDRVLPCSIRCECLFYSRDSYFICPDGAPVPSLGFSTLLPRL